MFTAVIPVRAGSQRVKNKNIRKFADSNLLVHKIRQLKLVPEINEIYVSSDSEEMLKMATDEGVKVHKRDDIYCDEKTAPFGEVVKNVAENVTGEHLLWSLCTAPLILPEHYSAAIRVYKDQVISDKTAYDSLIAVQPFKKYIWDDSGPVNFSLGEGHVPSQGLPQYYLTTGLRIAPRQSMVDWVYFTGDKPYKFPIDPKYCVDIDDEEDLELAHYLYKKHVSGS